MENVFLQQFLMISDIKTIVFLIALVALFALIHYMYIKKEIDFSIMVLVGTVLGLALGLVMQAIAGFPDDPTQITFIKEVTTWYSMIGNGFINLIKMLVVPLVMVSIMKVVIDMEQGSGMGKLVKTTIVVTMVMVAIAAAVGVVIGMLFQVGAGSTLGAGDSEAKAVTPVATTLMNLIPGNIVQAMVDPSKCTESIHELVEMYKPMLYGICADIFGIMKDLNRNDEWFAENAMYDKKLYDAYVNAGFTDEQSYELLVRDKIVRAENMKKSMTNKKTSTEKGK